MVVLFAMNTRVIASANTAGHMTEQGRRDKQVLFVAHAHAVREAKLVKRAKGRGRGRKVEVKGRKAVKPIERVVLV